MTISDRQKCFEERKQLESHPCRNHYVTLGVVRDAISTAAHDLMVACDLSVLYRSVMQVKVVSIEHRT